MPGQTTQIRSILGLDTQFLIFTKIHKKELAHYMSKFFFFGHGNYEVIMCRTYS